MYIYKSKQQQLNTKGIPTVIYKSSTILQSVFIDDALHECNDGTSMACLTERLPLIILVIKSHQTKDTKISSS